MPNSPRKAFTLTELLIVLFILSVLLGLLIQGVSSARNLANQVVGKRRISALFFATEQYAASQNGWLPLSVVLKDDPSTKVTIHQKLLWYMDGGRAYEEHMFDSAFFPEDYSYIQFLSPGDYSISREAGYDYRPGKLTSFSANAQVFGNKSQYPKSFFDGTSNTILFADRLAICGNTPFQTITNEIVIPGGFTAPIRRRPTFADGGTLAGKSLDDIFPVTDRNLAISKSSEPGFTFQPKPSPENCNPRVLQGLFGSLTCCMADGSVQSVSPSISNSIFWALVTPAGSETTGE